MRKMPSLINYGKKSHSHQHWQALYCFIPVTQKLDEIEIFADVPEAVGTISFDISENSVLRGNLNEKDAVALYTLVSSPCHGSVSLTYDGRFVYCPEKGFKGRDVFKYTYNNYLDESDECIVEIIVGA